MSYLCKIMMNKKSAGHLSILAANIFFGLNNPVSRSLMPEIVDPIVMTSFRIGGGMFLFWLASFFIKKEKVPLRDIFLYFGAAFFALTINQFPFIIGLSKTGAIEASIIVTMLPLISMLLAALILKEPITLLKAIGVLVGASGALLLVMNSHSTSGGSSSIEGNLLVFLAVVSFSLYLTLFKNLISKYSVITSMKWMFLFGVIQAVPFAYKPFQNTDFTLLNSDTWLKIGYVVIFATFLSYILVAMAQKALRPTTLSMYNYLQPIVASIAAVIIGIDVLGVDKILSALLVFSGVYIVTQSKSRAQLEAEKNGVPVDKEAVGN